MRLNIATLCHQVKIARVSLLLVVSSVVCVASLGWLGDGEALTGGTPILRLGIFRFLSFSHGEISLVVGNFIDLHVSQLTTGYCIAPDIFTKSSLEIPQALVISLVFIIIYSLTGILPCQSLKS